MMTHCAAFLQAPTTAGGRVASHTKEKYIYQMWYEILIKKMASNINWTDSVMTSDFWNALYVDVALLFVVHVID